eukprot:131784-Amphidinium_carterae.2
MPFDQHTVTLSNEIEVRLPGDSSATQHRKLPINSCNSSLMALRILPYEADGVKVMVNDPEVQFSSLLTVLTKTHSVPLCA